MPLWLSLLRPLAGNCAVRYPGLTSCKRLRQWQPLRAVRPNYSTASADAQRDDIDSSVGFEDVPTDAVLIDANGASSSASVDHVQEKQASEFQDRRGAHSNRTLVATRTSTTPPRRSLRANVSAARTAYQQHVKGVQKTTRPHDRATLHVRRMSGRTRLARTQLYKSRLPRIRKRQSKSIPVWHRQLSKLTNHLNDKHKRYLQPRYYPILDVRTLDWVEFALARLDNNDAIEDLPVLSDDPNRCWEQVALWLLAYDPESMLRFLRATHVEPYRHPTSICTSLLHLARHWQHSEHPDAVKHMRQLADLFVVLADRGGKDRLSFFDNAFVRILMRSCTDEQMLAMYHAIKTHRVQVKGHAYMHFATYFARNNHFQLALDALFCARDAGASVNGYAFRSNCSTLLRAAISEPEGLRVTLTIVSDLVDMGVQLDNPICDIIMLNAVEAGDFKTALAVYHSLMERGLKPTKSTFAILLKGCKMNIDDAETLNTVIRDAIANMNVRSSALVATEILHCLALHHSKHNPSTALRTLTEAYAQLFELSPLQKLGLPIPVISPQANSPSDDPPMQPTRHAMTFLIGACIEHHLTLKQTVDLYARWRQLVESGADVHLTNLATTHHLANLFLRYSIRTSAGLIHAARVIRDMQRILYGPALYPPGHPATEAPMQQCKPTVMSFSIFLHGLTLHSKPHLAEQLLAYMRKQGLEPNQVTWNTLVASYARAQDVDGAVDAMARMRDGGWEWNRWTHGALRRLERRGVVGKNQEVTTDFSREVKESLVERLKGARIVDHGESGASGFGDSPADLAEEEYQPFSS